MGLAKRPGRIVPLALAIVSTLLTTKGAAGPKLLTGTAASGDGWQTVMLELFSDLPPRQIEISLYGAAAETYETITGVAGSFERCLCGFCPAFFALETGAEDVRSEYLCAMGHLRFQADVKRIQRRCGGRVLAIGPPKEEPPNE